MKIKFLISKNMAIDKFAPDGATMVFNNSMIIEELNSAKNIFVFDSLEEASKYVLTMGGAQPPSAALMALRPETDFPIFEVEADDFPVRDKELPAVKDFSSDKIKVYAANKRPYVTQTTPTHHKESTGLNLKVENIKAVHSALQHKYTMDDDSLKQREHKRLRQG